MYALRWGKTRGSRTFFSMLALVTVGYIVAVALTRTVRPWEVLPG